MLVLTQISPLDRGSNGGSSRGEIHFEFRSIPHSKYECGTGYFAGTPTPVSILTCPHDYIQFVIASREVFPNAASLSSGRMRDSESGRGNLHGAIHYEFRSISRRILVKDLKHPTHAFRVGPHSECGTELITDY